MALLMTDTGTVLVETHIRSIARSGPDTWLVIAAVSSPREQFALAPIPTNSTADNGTHPAKENRS